MWCAVSLFAAIVTGAGGIAARNAEEGVRGFRRKHPKGLNASVSGR
jgi:hypothetical protein